MPEYEYRRTEAKREESVEIPEDAIGVSPRTRWSIEEEQSYVVVEFLVPVDGGGASDA